MTSRDVSKITDKGTIYVMFLSHQQKEGPRRKGGVRSAGPAWWDGSTGKSRAAAVAGLAGASSDGGRERECRRDGPSTTTGRAGTRAGGKGKEAGVALACAGGFRNEHKKVSSDRWFNQEKQCNYVSKCRERTRWRAERKATASSAPLRSQKMSTHMHFTTAD